MCQRVFRERIHYSLRGFAKRIINLNVFHLVKPPQVNESCRGNLENLKPAWNDPGIVNSSASVMKYQRNTDSSRLVLW